MLTVDQLRIVVVLVYARNVGALAYATMSAAYAPTVRLYRLPLWRALTLPLAAVLYTAMTIDSALRHARGQGGLWKGRPFTPANPPELQDSRDGADATD